jgi:hypothetical protein
MDAALEIVKRYHERQDVQDVPGCLELLADNAFFDVGRGTFSGKEQIANFLRDVLFSIHTQTDALEVISQSDETVTVLLTLSDDNTRRLQLPPVQVEARYDVREGCIASLHARPTPDSMQTVLAIRNATR